MDPDLHLLHDGELVLCEVLLASDFVLRDWVQRLLELDFHLLVQRTVVRCDELPRFLRV